jgi:hypothetical protein
MPKAARRWCSASAIGKGQKVLDLGCGDGTTALPGRGKRVRRFGCRHRAEPGRGGNEAGRGDRPFELHVPARRRADLQGIADGTFDIRRQHLRRDVRPKAVRRRQGDGSRSRARAVASSWGTGFRDDPTLVAQILRIQLGLHAASARGIHEPDDVGRRKPRGRAVCCCRLPADRVSFVPGYLCLPLRRIAFGRRRETSGCITVRR